MKNKMHMTRKTKDEKRRLAFEKRNVKKEMNLARYGAEDGSALVMAKTTDFNRRFVAAMLALVFAISCLVVGVNFATKADDSNTTSNSPLKPAGANGVKNDTNTMVLNKYLTPNENGNYDLTLEAYSTAEVKPITEKIPTDFVVVVDQSRSMLETDMPTGNPTVQNELYLEDIANGSYYYKDGDNYYRVYGVKDYLYRYYPPNYWFTGDIVNHFGTDLHWFMGESDATTNIANAFYFREVVNGTTYYQPIKTTVEGKVGTYYMRFSFPSKMTNGTYKLDREVTTYTKEYYNNDYSPWYKNAITGEVMDGGGRLSMWSVANGVVQGMYQDDDAYTYSTVGLPWPFDGVRIRTGMYINYPLYDRHVTYTKLCYRDVNGVEHEVQSNNNHQTTWEFCNSDTQAIVSQEGDRPTYSGLYTFSGTTSRMAALKAALNEFARAVADETDDYGKVDNRVSIIGFSSMSSSSTHDPDYHYNSSYDNTELLTHTQRDVSNNNGWQKNICDGNVSEYYGKGLVGATDGNAGTVNPKITNAINALTANGGTQPEDGLNMAYQVLTNRGSGEGKDKYTIRSGKEKGQQVDRNTVVIFFTDGQPGNYHESDQYAEANEVIAQAKQIKDYGKTLDYGTNIFSIGVFGESDGNPLTYDGKTDLVENPSNPDEQIQVKDLKDRKLWEFLGGWMETYRDGGTYYCLRRQWRAGADGYTESANDTIFDYMSVVSSNYPDANNYIAPEWLNGNFSGNYIAATDGDAARKKSTAETTNKYYRMASSQDTLVAAFLQAVTMNNEQSDPEPVPASSILIKDTISNDFNVKVNDDDQPTIKYYTQQGEMGDDGYGDFTQFSRVEMKNPPEGFIGELDGNTFTVTGFDFSSQYIAKDKNGVNAGRKLIVVIEDVIPKNGVTSQNGTLYSNQDGAGITIIEDDGTESSIGKFPRPYISRHSYTLDVGGENPDGKFNVVSTIVDSTGAAVLASDSALSDVIVVAPDRTRSLYSSSGGTSVATSGKDDVFYYENVPIGYRVKTEIRSTDGAFTYTWIDNENVTLDQTTAQAKNYEYADRTISITSKANSRNAFLTLETKGTYANTERQFPIDMEIKKGDTKYTGDITFKLNDSSTLTTLHFSQGTPTNAEELKLKHGDRIEFTNLPAGSSVTLTPSDDSGNVYTWTIDNDANSSNDQNHKNGLIDQSGYTFAVVYTRSEVTDTGVLGDTTSMHSGLLVFAGIATFVTCGAGYYFSYRKRREK